MDKVQEKKTILRIFKAPSSETFKLRSRCVYIKANKEGVE
jgi:hypothetical protein